MTKIEWTEKTWNPIVGCSITSPGCTNCYAMKMAARIEAMNHGAYLRLASGQTAGKAAEITPVHYHGTTKRVNGKPVWTGKLALAPDHILREPLRRKKPTTWFVNSMGDLFHEDCPDAWIDRVFAVMALCPQHTFQVLTKRSARMRAYETGDEYVRAFEAHWRGPASEWCHDGPRQSYLHPRAFPNWPLPNVWLGVSAEDQSRADERVPDLLATPAAVRFVSAEPLLGPIDLTRVTSAKTNAKLNALLPWRATRVGGGVIERGDPSPALDWVIVGGESGNDARPMVLGWAKDMVRQCQAAGVPVFVKQMGSQPTNREGERCNHIKHRKGADMSEWPAELQVRQVPSASAKALEPAE